MDDRSVDHRLFEEAAAGRCGTKPLVRAACAALGDIAAGRREVRAVRHPLGFLCFPVERGGDCGVCIHAFGAEAHEPAPPLTTSPVHAHSWDLTSCVLHGQVINVSVEVTEHQQSPTHRVFEIVSDPAGVDELRPTSRLVTHEAGPAQTSGAGDIYTLPAGQFHTTLVSGPGAATFLLGCSRPGGRDLSLGPLHGTGHRVVRQQCDAEQSARIAGSVLRRIHAPHRR
ncbi:hypothetical protein LKL35_00580 [Streptomyces sp. ET3-23]|uniref:hypothetical protein n=1 Tax=Streptomyces sp. ET3-23 TaxID=2885643 RepID=UPI001D12DFC5|nr:hypothetical protein [Streptomyces sp. ET3-23]MCC2273949.1 hypothetical protein [Streptomyces sp. ET3-23]